jgi:GTP cyclohydrolase I
VKPTKEEAEKAIRTLLYYIGEDPNREGLKDTPKRVVKSYEDFFRGYQEDPQKILAVTFKEIESYEEMITLENIDFESFCEHHMLPIVGNVVISYVPNQKVIGISKLARLVDVFAKRLQLQERMTSQIAMSISQYLAPKGVAVAIEARHDCISCRGVYKPGSKMRTFHFAGCFKDNENMKKQFFSLIKK